MPLPFLFGTGFPLGSEYVTDYLIGEVLLASNERQFLTQCSGFGVDEGYVYFVTEEVRKVSRTTGDISIIEK